MSDFEDDIKFINENYRQNCEPLETTFPWLKNDIMMLKAIYTKNVKQVKKYHKKEIHSRKIIYYLKNDPDSLDLFLKYNNDDSAGSYFFDEIKDNRTFDIYNKYGICTWNFRRSCVNDEQWAYIKKIGFIDEEHAKQLEEAYAKELAEIINTGG
jgi:hypothetical protein